jgi:spore coat polysaccharide biosynthesis protein SpsF
MEGGPLNRVLFIVQARMASTRLPGKILLSMPIGSTQTILDRVLNAAERSSYFGKVVVATSVDPQNAPVIELCTQRNIEVFVGDEENVYSRFFSVVQRESYDYIVRLTADNPLLDPDYIDIVIKHHINSTFDYTRSKGLPLGMNVEVFSKQPFLTLNQLALTDNEKEHVTLGFHRREGYHGQIFEFEGKGSEIRLTVDYPQDYALASLLYSLAESENRKPSLDFILQQKTEQPWLFEINANLEQIVPQ